MPVLVFNGARSYSGAEGCRMRRSGCCDCVLRLAPVGEGWVGNLGWFYAAGKMGVASG
jgi:hypothetical protein